MQNVPDTLGLALVIELIVLSAEVMYRLCVGDKAVHLIIAISFSAKAGKNTEFYTDVVICPDDLHAVPISFVWYLCNDICKIFLTSCAFAEIGSNIWIHDIS